MIKELWETRMLMFETEGKKKAALRTTSKPRLIAQASYFLGAGNSNTDALDTRKEVALSQLQIRNYKAAVQTLKYASGAELAFASDEEIHGLSDAQACLERVLAL